MGRRMKLDVVLLPALLQPEHLENRAVVVFDVLRATTSMTAALEVGVREIQVFGSLEAAVEAGAACTVPHLLCGERNAVKPEGLIWGTVLGPLFAICIGERRC